MGQSIELSANKRFESDVGTAINDTTISSARPEETEARRNEEIITVTDDDSVAERKHSCPQSIKSLMSECRALKEKNIIE